VFFLTAAQLSLIGTEVARDIHARFDGGFPGAAVALACTTTDACRTAPSPQPSIFGAPASETFSGVGKLAPLPPAVKARLRSMKCHMGFVKRERKCVKKSTSKARKSVHVNKKTGK
jgi:hypothetical protein